MLGIGVFVLAAGFQLISAQGQPPNFPPQCRGPPPGVERPHECCKIPRFFPDEDFAECGFQKLDGTGPPQRHGPPDCSKQLCMLNKYDLLLEDKSSLNLEAIAVFMDKWGETNAAFQPAVEAAKIQCLKKDLPGPPHICEANRLVFCISSTLFAECPVWEETDGCKTLKEHLDLCKPFFVKQ